MESLSKELLHNPELFSHTLEFISKRQISLSINPTIDIANNSLLVLNEILTALQVDGWSLKPPSIDNIAQVNPSSVGLFGSNYLRRLSESSSSGGSDLITNIILVLVCVICAGFASGLTQGLLALDFMEMKIKSQSGTAKEKEYASKLLPIISNHHLLLVTLMLWNASATEALPIFLDKLVPEYVAIILSVTMVLLFGEIIPASILTGPKQMQISASLTPLVYIVLTIFFPIAYPISKLLDVVIGHDEAMTMYTRTEIVTMMRLQHEEGRRRATRDSTSIRDTMNQDEVTIVGGALTFRDMKTSEVMTHEKNIFMISCKEKLSYKIIYDIFKAGYSRIPVYDEDRSDIVGLILAKDLIFVDPEDEIPIENFIHVFGRKPLFVWHDEKLGETLSLFQRERAHMALVRDVVDTGSGDPVYKVVGLITLEDIIEEILGAEIEDEFDYDENPTENTVERNSVATQYSEPVRDIDLARLKSLRTKITDEALSSDEIEAIVNFLLSNVPQAMEMFENDRESLVQVIRKAGVLSMKKKTPIDDKPHHDDFIFRKGKLSNSCMLILQGRVKVLKGSKEEEESYSGPWTILGADAMILQEGTYIPDFSACIDSEYIRVVRISSFKSMKFSDGVEGLSNNERRKLGFHRRPSMKFNADSNRSLSHTRLGSNERKQIHFKESEISPASNASNSRQRTRSIAAGLSPSGRIESIPRTRAKSLGPVGFQTLVTPDEKSYFTSESVLKKPLLDEDDRNYDDESDNT